MESDPARDDGSYTAGCLCSLRATRADPIRFRSNLVEFGRIRHLFRPFLIARSRHYIIYSVRRALVLSGYISSPTDVYQLFLFMNATRLSERFT